MPYPPSLPSFAEKALFVLAFAAFIGYVLYLSTAALTENPVVYKSWSYQKCMRVKSHDDKHSCDNLPEKYTLVWIK